MDPQKSIKTPFQNPERVVLKVVRIFSRGSEVFLDVLITIF